MKNIPTEKEEKKNIPKGRERGGRSGRGRRKKGEGVEEKNESKERKWLPPRVVASRARDCNFCTSSHIVWLVSLKISVIYKFLF